MDIKAAKKKKNQICLCSSSPTRALLLERFGIDFIQKIPSYDEDQINAATAKDFAYRASKGKMEAALKEFGLDLPLLCADTVIATSNGMILRKPKNIEDARRILHMQSGSIIAIISSVHFRSKKLLFSDISATWYHFKTFDSSEMEMYLQSGLWQGKAGGCMVEGFCKKYIKKTVGLESTAMGLQVEKVLPWMGK